MSEEKVPIIGKLVKFNAARLFKGNPVIGEVLQEDSEWITVKLSHSVEGMVTVWEAGAEKNFRKSLINGEIQVLN